MTERSRARSNSRVSWELGLYRLLARPHPLGKQGISLTGVCLATFLTFAGASSNQFHSYLFERLGFGALHVGLLISAGFAAGILSPLAQAWIIRLSGGTPLPLLSALGGAALCLGFLPAASSFPGLMLLFFLFSFCASAAFPLITTFTLDALRHRGGGLIGAEARGHGAYFRIRGLGTAGFLVGCVISASYSEWSSLPWLYLGFATAYLLAFIVVAALHRHPRPALPKARNAGAYAHPHAHAIVAKPRSLRQTFHLLCRNQGGRTGRLLALIGGMSLANSLALCVQGNYLVGRFAGGQASISRAWVISTACEVPIMFLCGYLLRKTGLRGVMALGLAGTWMKVAGLGMAGELWQYYLALSLHGCFYAGAAAGFNVYLDRHFSPTERPALQSLSLVFIQGLPNALAGLLAGLIWHFLSLRAVYLAACGIATVAALYGLILAKPFYISWFKSHPPGASE